MLTATKTRCFKLYRAYSISIISSNVGNFFLEFNCKRLSQCSGKEKESRCPVFTSLKKREIASFTSQSCSDGKLKKCTKKRAARAQLLFCQSKPIAFLTFLLTSPSSLLKLPKEASIDGNNCSRVWKLLLFSWKHICSKSDLKTYTRPILLDVFVSYFRFARVHENICTNLIWQM